MIKLKKRAKIKYIGDDQDSLTNLDEATAGYKSRIAELEASDAKHHKNLRDIKFQLKSFLNQSSESLEKILTDLEEFNSFHEELSTFFTKVSESLKIIQDSESSLKSAFDEIQSKSHLLDEIEALLVNRSQSTGSTLSSLQEVKKLAEKTEIISYNASIEAAHAGSQGKGFAVISKQLSHFSGEIKGIIASTSQGLLSIIEDLKQIDERFSGTKRQIDDQFVNMQDIINSNLSESHSLEEEILARTAQMKARIEGFKDLSLKVSTTIEAHSHQSTALIGSLENQLVVDIECEDVRDKLQRYHIVDVRKPEEYVGELGHLKGSQLITIDDHFTEKIKSLSQNETYLFVCRSGGRSARAAQLAADQGFTRVFNLKGGMLRWNELKQPVVRESRQTG